MVTAIVGDGIAPIKPAPRNKIKISCQCEKELGNPINHLIIYDAVKASQRAPKAINAGMLI